MALVIVEPGIGAEPVESFGSSPMLDCLEEKPRNPLPAVLRIDPQILDIGRPQVRSAFRIVALAGVDHPDRFAFVGQSQETDVGLGKRGEARKLFLELHRGKVRMKARKHGRPCTMIGRRRAADDQTVKLSPQPQAPLAFGFSNTKPAAKSSSRQSIVEPMR